VNIDIPVTKEKNTSEKERGKKKSSRKKEFHPQKET